jgi:hypothetical protein
MAAMASTKGTRAAIHDVLDLGCLHSAYEQSFRLISSLSIFVWSVLKERADEESLVEWHGYLSDSAFSMGHRKHWKAFLDKLDIGMCLGISS